MESGGGGELVARVQELEKRVKELSTLLDVASQVAGPVELPEVLGALLTSTASALDLRVCFVALVTPGREWATVAASWVRGRSPQLALKDTSIRVADYPLARWALSAGKPIHVRNLEDTRLTDVDRRNMVQTGCSSALVVPAKAGGEVVSLLALSWGGEAQIADEGERLAQAVAAHAALAIQRAKLYTEQQDARRWLGLVLDAVPAAVYCLDSERRIRWLNRAAREMAGVGPSLADGTHCYDIVELWDAKGNSVCQGHCPALESFRRRRTIHSDDLHLTRADGRLVPVRARNDRSACHVAS